MADEKIVKLSNPPIVETALCVTFEREHFSSDEVVRLASTIAPGFKFVRNFLQKKFDFEVGFSSAKTQDLWQGAQFVKDKNLVLSLQNVVDPQRSLVVFAFSILPPYTSWEDFLKQAMPVYEAFWSANRDVKIVRIGLRSIDRLKVPAYSCPLNDLLKTIPPDVKGLPAPQVSQFAYRETSFFAEKNLYATVARTMENASSDIIFDTDVFHIVDCRIDRAYFLEKLDSIHQLRDLLFFNSIGDKMLENYR